MNRREHLLAMGTLLAGAALPVRAQTIPAAADSSELIYLTPMLAGGRESNCQAEVWFVRDASDFYVVTAEDAWRARAVRAGIDGARIWVGDVGVWSSSARYKKLPMLSATGSLVSDGDAHAEVLAHFGRKYPGEWSTWGPRFTKGLADGSRVLLKYRVS